LQIASKLLNRQARSPQ